MNDNFQQQILSTYSTLFPKPVTMYCGNGWFWLIDNMCKKLAKHKETYDTKVYIKAIEQKFATLTVYMEYATGTELDIIQNATNASYTVCEDCGNPGEFHSDNGWEYILCNDCTIFHILQKD